MEKRVCVYKSGFKCESWLVLKLSQDVSQEHPQTMAGRCEMIQAMRTTLQTAEAILDEKTAPGFFQQRLMRKTSKNMRNNPLKLHDE